MSQADSIHFLRPKDRVRDTMGREGVVTETLTHSATVQWDDGEVESVDQLHPAISVIVRYKRESAAEDEGESRARRIF